MRYKASEKREIIDLVEQSSLPVRRTLDQLELSAREIAVHYTETRGYFVLESSVYRLLKAHDLITSPAFILMKAADKFQHPTTAPHSKTGSTSAAWTTQEDDRITR